MGFLKIDVEGHEAHVLRGAAARLARGRPNVLIEVEDRHTAHSVEDVRRFFAGRSYSGYFLMDGTMHPISDFKPEMQDISLIGSGFYVNNFVYLPDETAAAVCDKILTIG